MSISYASKRRRFPTRISPKRHLRMGYHVVYKGDKGYSGVATASLLSPDEVWIGLTMKSRRRGAPLRTRFGDLRNHTYVPQGKAIDHPDYGYKFRFFRRLRALFEHQLTADDFVLWVGDMNVNYRDRRHSPRNQKNTSASTRTSESSLKK